MITTVTLNPAIDKTITVENFRLNSVNRTGNVYEDIGGKGINVSKVLNLLGERNVSLGFIGERNYSFAQTLIKKQNIISDFILVDAYTRINTKIIDPVNKTTTDINEAGFSVQSIQVEQMKLLIKTYSKSSEFVVFSGSVCQGISHDDFKEMLSLAQDSKLVLDADREILKIGLTCTPYLIKPNIHELEDLLGKKLNNTNDVIDSSKELIERYGITFVLVSLGEEGSILVSKNVVLKANSLKVDVKSTVGAGDSMLAGFLYGLSKNMSLEDALKYASCCGGFAVSGESLSEFRSKNIIDYLNNISVEVFN